MLMDPEPNPRLPTAFVSVPDEARAESRAARAARFDSAVRREAYFPPPPPPPPREGLLRSLWRAFFG